MKEVPPFHLTGVITLVINRLDRVELWWNYGWNYMKFHPNSTRNSTTFKHLIFKTITAPRWKGGITNDKKYFSGKEQENILTTVKSLHFYGSHLFLGNRKIRLFLVKSVLTRQYIVDELFRLQLSRRVQNLSQITRRRRIYSFTDLFILL